MTSPLAWQPHVDAWLLVLVVGGAYAWALSALAPAGRPAATARQRTCFAAGLAALWVGADWPINGLAEAWFSAHMAQHLLFSLVAAPLLILGTPGWLLRRLLRPRPVRAAWRALTTPIVALLVPTLWTAAYHWPPIVELSVRSAPFHLLVHVLWVSTALVMWWPVLSPLPELPHLSYPGRMAYLFGHSLLPTVPASFLTFGQQVLYPTYGVPPRFLGFDPITDQQVAGLLMKVGGGFFLWAVIAWLFFRWQSEEQSGGPDVLYWRDLEPSLQLELADR